MRWIRALTLVVQFLGLFLGLMVLPVQAQTYRLLGAVGGDTPGVGDSGAVIEIDQTTGEVTVLGFPWPTRGLSGIAALPDGRVIVSTQSPSLDEGSAVMEIDPNTGALVRWITAEARWLDGTTPLPIHDLAVDPTTGELYAVGYGTANAVVTMDLGTGDTTLYGHLYYSVFFPPAETAAIGFTSQGELWSKVDTGPGIFGSEFLFGDLVPVPLPVLPPSYGALGMAVHPVDDTVFSSECCDGAVPGNDIYRESVPDSSATFLTSAGDQREVHDLALVGMPPSLVEVPTLSSVALAFLALILATGAVVVLRRNAPSQPS